MWRRLSFAAARNNLHAAARDGIGARLHWPGRGQVEAADLVLEELLPLAAAGLDRWRIDPRERDLYLGIIEARARTRRNGAIWQMEQVEHLERKRGLSRARRWRRWCRGTRSWRARGIRCTPGRSGRRAAHDGGRRRARRVGRTCG